MSIATFTRQCKQIVFILGRMWPTKFFSFLIIPTCSVLNVYDKDHEDEDDQKGSCRAVGMFECHKEHHWPSFFCG